MTTELNIKRSIATEVVIDAQNISDVFPSDKRLRQSSDENP